MKKHVSHLFLLLFLAFTSCNAGLHWAQDRPLTWDDFKGSGNGNTHDANTFWSVRYRYQLLGKNNGTYLLNFRVYAAFNPGESWVNPLHKGSGPLLKHEQLHFDIAELYTRKLYIAFNEKTYSANYRREVRAIFDEWFKGLKDAQSAYDTQSEHSLNKAAQAGWEATISDELKKTPPYPLLPPTAAYKSVKSAGTSSGQAPAITR